MDMKKILFSFHIAMIFPPALYGVVTNNMDESGDRICEKKDCKAIENFLGIHFLQIVGDYHFKRI